MSHIIIHSPAKMFLTSSGNPNSAAFQWLFNDLNGIYKSVLSTSQRTHAQFTPSKQMSDVYMHTHFQALRANCLANLNSWVLRVSLTMEDIESLEGREYLPWPGSLCQPAVWGRKARLNQLEAWHILLGIVYKWNENIGFGLWWKIWPSTASCGLQTDLTHPQSWPALTVL